MATLQEHISAFDASVVELWAVTDRAKFQYHLNSPESKAFLKTALSGKPEVLKFLQDTIPVLASAADGCLSVTRPTFYTIGMFLFMIIVRQNMGMSRVID